MTIEYELFRELDSGAIKRFLQGACRSLKVLEYNFLTHGAWTKNRFSPFLCHIRYYNEPFLYSDLSSLLRTFVEHFVKSAQISSEP